jgi:L-2-hydroxyglutarate oxidase LhgO
MTSLQGDAESAGALTVFGCEVKSGSATVISGERGIILNTTQGEIFAETVINCAGLYAIKVASLITGYPVQDAIPNAYFAKGNYFKMESSNPPFSRLIYPLPEKGGLGIHATIDMAGAVRFGPDVEWLQECLGGEPSYHHREAIPEDFSVNPQRDEKFYHAIRRYWPGLPDGSLVPDYSGIRPKVSGPMDPNDPDFMIEGPRQHGVAGLINLFGIESPGLTSSLSIAEYVDRLIEDSKKSDTIATRVISSNMRSSGNSHSHSHSHPDPSLRQYSSRQAFET